MKRDVDGDKKKPAGEKPKPSRTDQARLVVQAYADDLRKIIEKLRKTLGQADLQRKTGPRVAARTDIRQHAA